MKIINFFKKIVAINIFLLSSVSLLANFSDSSLVSFNKIQGAFSLYNNGTCANIFVSTDDYPGVISAAKDLQSDIKMVTSKEPSLDTGNFPKGNEIIIIGTLGKNKLINKLVSEKKIDTTGLFGKWETFSIQTIQKPFTGVEKALVIIGSDKRGTIYGIYNISENIGVSPWYWWADVPVKHQSQIFIKPGNYSIGEPKVKYRGIFINDEAPALSGWVYEKFGGFNHKFYEKVFELILRLKGNYLWPAMWGNAFNTDDSLDAKLADEYGIVMGTSHHEPMMRAQQEWKKFGNGPWNYQTNEETLKAFWRQGIINMGKHESVVTIGMRGDGDLPMSEGSNISLLEKIVKDQRNIIQDVTGKDPSETPQDWALYKEVQDYYDKGMRVPDDVTLLLCDDNWGNIRKLPALDAKPRKGGYGIYYHFDYVGDPRNYKWLNTNSISRVWEQMHLAWQYGDNKIWIVNVGDIKPMEFPISFFLDYAWNPTKIEAEDIGGYTHNWAEKQFGPKYANEIADILAKYTKYNSRRKPELLSPETYSLVNYNEAVKVVDDYNLLFKNADSINNLLPENYKDAYFQLVLHPVMACANLNTLYYIVAKNRLYAAQSRILTNELADSAKKLFRNDAAISHYYNKIMAGGKWDHMMDQTHIGYTYWQQPDSNTMPTVKYIQVQNKPEVGICVEGDTTFWPNDTTQMVIPESSNYENINHYFEIFDRGDKPFNYTIKSTNPGIILSSEFGTINNEKRIWVKFDWDKLQYGSHKSAISLVFSTGQALNINIPYNKIDLPKNDKIGFVESNGYVSIEATHYTNAINQEPLHWQIIPDLGRTLSAVTIFPTNIKSQPLTKNSAHLEYKFFVIDTGIAKINVYLSPTLNFTGKDGLKYAISIDDKTPQIENVNNDKRNETWQNWVANNINITSSNHSILKNGEHTLKFWCIDPALDLQKIVIDMNGEKPSYLGPPESFHFK